MARHVERSIEVGVPVRTAYDQWTQFEEFPRFMSGVQEVRQIADALTHWVAEIAGVRREWDAAILEQVPDEKVAWAATTGATNAGAVYFTAVGPDRTRVRLTLDYEPEGIVERIGDILDIVDRQAVADLDRFKEFIEQRGSATGGWRGTVEEGGVQPGSAAATGAAPGTALGGTAGTAGGRADDATRVGGTGGPTADAATSSSGVAGFGTDTGTRSEDAASGVLTGDPGTGGRGTAAGGGEAAAWGDEPGARTGTTEAATDPVGESWSDDTGTRAATTGSGDAWGGAGDTTTDPVGEPWSSDDGGTGAEPGPAGRDREEHTVGSRAAGSPGTTDEDTGNRGVTTGMGGAWAATGNDEPDALRPNA